MTRYRFFPLLLAFTLILFPFTVVLAVPPLPTTLHGKVQAGGTDVPDGTHVSAWMGSSEAVTPGTPLSFEGTGVSITFSAGCSGEVTVLHQAGQAQVISQDGYTSVYALDVHGPSDWVPPDDPVTEGQPITLKISDTIATTTTWSMGASAPLTLTVDSFVGTPPYSPGNVTLLGQVWDISIDCANFTATVTFTYDEAWLAGTDEADIVGMARYDVGYNRWEYLAGTVDTEANTVTISDVTAFSQWRILASAPPKPVANLIVAKSGSDLVLDWSEVIEDIKGQAISGVTYNIYRAVDDPYFTPSGAPYDATGDTIYTDVGAVGDPNTNYYYVVTAVDAAGKESAASARVGEFDFALVSGAPPADFKYNFIAFPLKSVPGITDADSLGAAIGGVEQVLKYDCTTQDFPWPTHIWLPPYQQGTNFTLETGQVYLVQLNASAPAVFTLVGQVPAKGEICFNLCKATGIADFKYNLISLPLDRADLASADQLATDIGGVQQVLKYDAASQDFPWPSHIWLPPYQQGTDFALQIGYPYMVQLDNSSLTQWPCK